MVDEVLHVDHPNGMASLGRLRRHWVIVQYEGLFDTTVFLGEGFVFFTPVDLHVIFHRVFMTFLDLASPRNVSKEKSEECLSPCCVVLVPTMRVVPGCGKRLLPALTHERKYRKDQTGLPIG